MPLIGFSGSPWTLACYMVEGAGSDDYRLVKTMLYDRPDLLHRILAINAEAVAAYLNAQIDAGAQAVMVFDSWGGVLADGAFQAFSLAYTRRVLGAPEARRRRPARAAHRLHQGRRAVARGRSPQRAPTSSASTGRCNLGAARARVGDGVALQGNLDPAALFAGAGRDPTRGRARSSPASVAATQRAARNGHVFNLGHGISQHTPPESVAVLVEAVHRLSRALSRCAES